MRARAGAGLSGKMLSVNVHLQVLPHRGRGLFLTRGRFGFRLAGVYPVICTPFDADDRIDHYALAKELRVLFENGASGAVVAITTRRQARW
jgi:hypothetical protein